MLGIANYFWRLIPANPILLRVVDAGGRRVRDLIIRCAYLGLLVFLVAFASLNAGTDLSALAQTSGDIFKQMSYLQLALVSLLAPVFTAGAITQEKDSQTYDILLATPLSNGQIVLGSLLSRLFFVIALLISGLPVFSITQIFGGVAIGSIATSFAIAAATAFVTGALAMAIATFKVGTRRTIFGFYVFIVVYLVGGVMLDRLPAFKVNLTDPVTQAVAPSSTSWLAAINPFLALQTVVGENYHPPSFGELPETLRGWPISWILTKPASFYVSSMFALSCVLVIPSIVLLRWMAQTTLSPRAWVLQKMHLSTGDRTRKPRTVWLNPIAWREARTKASAGRAVIIRYGFMVLGIGAAIFLASLYAMVRPIGDGYDRFIMADDYSPATRTVTIDSAAEAKTYRVQPGTTLTYNGNPSTWDDLHGKLAVTDVTVGLGNSLNSITLATIPRRISAPQARTFLLGAVLVEMIVILLIVTNAAASTVTREKEDGSLDLLLTTPITSRYYIWGKLRGLVAFVLPLVAVPVASVGVFVLFDFIRTIVTHDQSTPWIAFWESIVLLPPVLTILCAFAAIVGMQMSLRCRTTTMAVMASVGIVGGACGFLGFCGYQTMASSDSALFIAGFSPFTLITLLIDPITFGGRTITSATTASELQGDRGLLFVVAMMSVILYSVLVGFMYKSMVKNFDMTIRRQSR